MLFPEKSDEKIGGQCVINILYLQKSLLLRAHLNIIKECDESHVDKKASSKKVMFQQGKKSSRLNKGNELSTNMQNVNYLVINQSKCKLIILFYFYCN